MPAIQKKIADINSSSPSSCLVDLSALGLLVQNLSAPTETSISSVQVKPLVDLITSWPLESRFPGLDLLRLVALRGVRLEGYEWPAFVETYAFEGVVGREEALKKEEETNAMLGLRCLANLFESQAGREAVMLRNSETIAVATDLWKRMSNKNAKLALVTLFLNFSVLFSKDSNEEDAYKLVGTLVEHLKTENDPETIYRALVAIGTLILTLPSAKEAAVIHEAKSVITGLKTKPGTERRSADVANEIIALL
jgi:phospholipase A-2-activating protein